MSKIERINSELQQQISNIILYDIADVRLKNKLISVIDVSTDTALTLSQVYISIYSTDVNIPTQSVVKEVFQALESCNQYIRTLLKKRMKIRNMPQLIFKLDKSVDYGIHIDDIINKKLK